MKDVQKEIEKLRNIIENEFGKDKWSVPHVTTNDDVICLEWWIQGKSLTLFIEKDLYNVLGYFEDGKGASVDGFFQEIENIKGYWKRFIER